MSPDDEDGDFDLEDSIRIESDNEADSEGVEDDISFTVSVNLDVFYYSIEELKEAVNDDKNDMISSKEDVIELVEKGYLKEDGDEEKVKKWADKKFEHS